MSKKHVLKVKCLMADRLCGIVGQILALYPQVSGFNLGYVGGFSKPRQNLTWRNTPAHHWYEDKRHDLSLQCRRSRALQTALARLRSGNLRSMTYVPRAKFSLPVPALFLLLLLIFWTAGYFPWTVAWKSRSGLG
ncbi:hypothetical protein TNCV_5122111 [Trichonephila clavipes]|nr:hypothetical protein TNCV_5122111 [Trichonephila clavipes]